MSSNLDWAKALAMLMTVAWLALMKIRSLLVVRYGWANWANISSTKLLKRSFSGWVSVVRRGTV